MTRTFILSAGIFLGLSLCGYFIGGRYHMISLGQGRVARLDRLSGAVVICFPAESAKCGWTAFDPNRDTLEAGPKPVK